MTPSQQLALFPDTELVDAAANENIFPLDWRQAAATLLVQRIAAGDTQVSPVIIHTAATNVGFAQLMTAAGFTFPNNFPTCWGTGTCTGTVPG